MTSNCQKICNRLDYWFTSSHKHDTSSAKNWKLFSRVICSVLCAYSDVVSFSHPTHFGPYARRALTIRSNMCVLPFTLPSIGIETRLLRTHTRKRQHPYETTHSTRCGETPLRPTPTMNDRILHRLSRPHPVDFMLRLDFDLTTLLRSVFLIRQPKGLRVCRNHKVESGGVFR